MTTLRVLLHVVAHRDYELHSLDFSTAFLQGSLHEEIWLRRPPGFTESFPAGTQWSLRQPIYGLRQAPREWHDTLRATLAALGGTLATAAPTPHCCRSTSSSTCKRDTPALTWVLLRFSFQFSSPQPTPLSTSHSLSAPPSDKSVELSGPYPELVGCLTYLLTDLGEQLVCLHGPYPELVGCLMYLMTCTQPDVAYPLSLLACYVAPVCQAWGSCLEDKVQLSQGYTFSLRHWVDDSATQRSSQGYTFSLGSSYVSSRSTRSSSVLSSSCEAEIYAGAMAA
ncbi:unnamed protein product [Closterium sp. NIES-53]